MINCFVRPQWLPVAEVEKSTARTNNKSRRHQKKKERRNKHDADMPGVGRHRVLCRRVRHESDALTRRRLCRRASRPESCDKGASSSTMGGLMALKGLFDNGPKTKLSKISPHPPQTPPTLPPLTPPHHSHPTGFLSTERDVSFSAARETFEVGSRVSRN